MRRLICIVGSGVAGMTLAKELMGSRLRVLILVRWRKKDKSKSQGLYRSKVVGLEHDGIHNGRFRVLGGSSTRWGGQLMTFREMDFARRDYIAGSGWPLTYDDLNSYYERAETIMKVNSLSYEEDAWETFGVNPIGFDRKSLRYRFSKWAAFKDRNLAKTVGRDCGCSNTVNIVFHANVTEINLSENGRVVESLCTKIFSGKQAKVTAKVFILCAGTIENARLLLASRKVAPNGVGNDYDLVGRFFQDHISYRATRLIPSDAKAFCATFDPFYRGSTMHSVKLDMADEAQERFRCTHVMGHVVFDFSEESGFYELRRIPCALQAKKNPLPAPMGAWRLLRFTDDLVRMLLGACIAGRRLAPQNARSYLQLEAEQAPAVESRVYLVDEKDELGMPRVALNWQLSEGEKYAMQKYVELFKAEWDRLRLGKARWDGVLFEQGDAWLDRCRDTYNRLAPPE